MKKINTTFISGLLYEHDLQLKTTGENSKNPGTEYISGTISIATDDAVTNIVPVHFTYVTSKTAKGNGNATFNLLSDIINGTVKSVMEHGQEVANKLRIDSAIGLNDFYTNRDGEETLVSAKRNEGGFVHTTKDLDKKESNRNTFTVDMLITGLRRIEEDVEKELPEKMIVKGEIFDFRGSLLPVEFTALNPDAMDYFESLEPSQKNPVFTRVWGNQVSTVIKSKRVTKSAFGEDMVREVQSNRKDWVITGANPEPYDFDTEKTITAEEVKKARADREIYLAEVKQRYQEYQASKGVAATAKAPVKKGDFNF